MEGKVIHERIVKGITYELIHKPDCGNICFLCTAKDDAKLCLRLGYSCIIECGYWRKK